MGTSQYSSSFGRLQSISINFLSEAIIQNLLKANDIKEMITILDSTWYGEEIRKAASVYQGSELLEVTINRHLVEINKILFEATPFGGKNSVRAYLSKWDLYNIELVLSSKNMGRTITETESLLISSRNVPAGILAGNISHDDMKIILAESGVEGVVNQLAKFGYGVILMQYLDEYQKTGDIAPMMTALHSFYYQNLLESIKFFQGDEGAIRELIRTQIDKKNILTIMKGKESDLEKEMVEKHLVDGGKISKQELLEIYGVKNVIEIVGKIESHFKLNEALEQYKSTNSLIDFEVDIDKFIFTTYVKKLKNISLSLGTIFYFMLNAEQEHENIKRVTYGKRYNLSNERISSMLIT